MSTTFIQKEQRVIEQFKSYSSKEEVYDALIQLGHALPLFSFSDFPKEALVSGCQSTMYIKSTFSEGLLHFQVASDALISKGLAAVLLAVYEGESPETILTTPPHFIEELHLEALLTPGRSNGLHQIHLKLKQEALYWLTHKK